MVVDREAGKVYLSSADFRSVAAGRSVRGAIHVFELDGEGRAPSQLEHDLDGPLVPHGIDLYRGEDGERRLFVVNHPEPTASRIEIFAIEGERLRHLRTIEGPELVSINDITAVGPESFYATNDAGTAPNDALRPFRTYLRLPWSNVVYFDGDDLRFVAEGLRYGNGIAISEDGTTLFVAETTGRRLRVYDRNPDNGTLTEQFSEEIPSGLDNISLAPDGRLWIGSHPKLLDFVAHAEDPNAHSPSQVLRLEVRERHVRVEELYLNDGAELSGSSVALPVSEGRFLVGSVFEPHFLDCRLQ